MTEFPSITKLEAANRQLCAAISLFFKDGDAVAVHTLACAAREIYEKHCRKAGQTRMFDFVKEGNPGYSDKQLWDLLNKARNFFKHEGTALDDQTEFNDTMNDFQLIAAATDCATLCSPHQPAEVQAYTIWFLATGWPDDDEGGGTQHARILRAEIDRRYPGLRTASRAEKKRFGRRLLEEAKAGRLVERGSDPSDISLAPGVTLIAE